MKILEWWAEKGRIRVRFPYDAELVAEVKEVPGRRWHREEKAWSIPLESAGEAGRILLPLGFRAAPEVEKLLTGEIEGIAGLAQASEEVRENAEGDHAAGESTDWSVSRLNEEVRNAILQGMPATLWLQGEVMGADRSLGRGSNASHLYFKLVEKEADADRPLAEVSAVMWNFRRDPSFRKLEENGTPLADGLRIRVKVRLDLYVARGQFQVTVEEIDPDFTLGELARRREEILAEIRRLGIDRENLDRNLPEVPLRVGVVTSPGSDAWKDFHDELVRSGFAFEITLCGARVQGEGAEADLLAALEFFASRREDFDVVVVIRGGGSRTDLMAFDTLDLARAVALHPVKVIVGIGHHADRSVLDELAHSEKTPTAVGQFLVSTVQESWDSVVETANAICERAHASIEMELQRQLSRGQRIALLGNRALAVAVDKREAQRLRCQRQLARTMRQEKDSLTLLARRIHSATTARTQLERERQQSRARRLLSTGVKSIGEGIRSRNERRRRLATLANRALTHEREQWSHRQHRTRSADPQQILGRGFAWIKNEDGATVRKTAEVRRGERIRIRLSDGSLDAQVE